MTTADYYRVNDKRRGILGHISFGVRSYETSKKFYTAIFKPLGILPVFDSPDRKVLGYGIEVGQEVFTIFERGNDAHAPGAGTHLAFNAPSRYHVDKFFDSGVQNGGTSDGRPGIRKHYGENYYATFLVDPDGFRIEAVFQEPVEKS